MTTAATTIQERTETKDRPETVAFELPEVAAIPLLGLLVAVGSGLLIGLERERRKGDGDDRGAAGVRTFTVAALVGALAQGIGAPGLVAVGAAAVGALVCVAHARSRSEDPGLTTELALFATYLIGVVSVIAPLAGGALGAALAGLLAARTSLHRFATRLLTEQELRDGLLLAALGLIVLPLVPSARIEWLGGVDPRRLASLVFVILVLQAAGHVALRWLGASRGLVVTGFVSGFVSSTVTIATMGRRARNSGGNGGIYAAAAIAATSATWIQVIVMSAALSTHAARVLAPTAGVATAVALACAAAGWLLARKQKAEGDDEVEKDRRALRPREALVIAAMLTVVTVAVSLAQSWFGSAGVYAGAAVGGLADAHAPVASLAALHAGGHMPENELVLGVVIAVSANSVTRTIVAFSAGGAAYGLRIAIALAAGLAAAWITALGVAAAKDA